MLIDTLPDAVMALAGDHTILEVNAAAASLTGYARDELVGASCPALLEPRTRDGRRVWERGWPRSARLRSVKAIPEQEVILRRKDGREARAYVTGAYVRTPSGELDGVIVSLRDAGRRQHQAVAGIEIVSTVSHELRSPLTSVKGYTSLLLNRWDRLTDDQKKMMLEQVNHDADRVTRLITELLDISRLETGRLVLRRQLVDIPALAATVVEKVALEYSELDCNLDFTEKFPRVFADSDKLEQVLTNLVENACKYASPRGIEVQGEIDGDHVRVAVSDKGEGIPSDDLPRVFDKFFRRAEGRPTGSGLGLWISRGLVEAHGGTLEASSEAGDGTTFRFTLPLADYSHIDS